MLLTVNKHDVIFAVLYGVFMVYQSQVALSDSIGKPFIALKRLALDNRFDLFNNHQSAAHYRQFASHYFLLSSNEQYY